MRFFFFFFNDTATTEIYTLSLHDALPISVAKWVKVFSRGQPSNKHHSQAFPVIKTPRKSNFYWRSLDGATPYRSHSLQENKCFKTVPSFHIVHPLQSQLVYQIYPCSHSPIEYTLMYSILTMRQNFFISSICKMR